MKVSFLGAGSVGFTQTLVRDILKVKKLQNIEISLHDISRKNLLMVAELIQKDIIRNKGEELKSYLNLHMVGTCDFSSRLWNLISLNIWLNSNYFI